MTFDAKDPRWKMAGDFNYPSADNAIIRSLVEEYKVGYNSADKETERSSPSHGTNLDVNEAAVLQTILEDMLVYVKKLQQANNPLTGIRVAPMRLATRWGEFLAAMFFHLGRRRRAFEQSRGEGPEET